MLMKLETHKEIFSFAPLPNHLLLVFTYLFLYNSFLLLSTWKYSKTPVLAELVFVISVIHVSHNPIWNIHGLPLSFFLVYYI